MSWLLAFAGFAALVVLHELGHFLAAKSVGMRVERFALFFPPLLFKVKRGETEYGIGAIPLGGYVRITGMNPNEEIEPEHEHRAYYKQAVWKRIFVIAAGPLMNILLAFLILWGLLAIQGPAEVVPRVQSIEAGGAAAGVLQKGDTLVSVDGKVGKAEVLSKQVASHKCAESQFDGCNAETPAVLVVRRAGELKTIEVTPRYDPVLKRTRLGFGFDIENNPVPVGAAAGDSVTEMWRITTESVSRITKIFYDAEARKEVSGVVGSYETTRQAIKFDTAQAIYILGLISLSLAIINLFPFLPLDGGHIFWALAEKIRGKAIAFSVLERASVVGFVLVLMLFAIGLTNDINRLQGEGFGLR